MKDKEQIEKQTQENWLEIWKPLLYTDGKLDIKKIENEMHDLIFIYEQVSKVYYSLTGGALSKPMYYAEEIISIHGNEVEEAYDEGYADGRNSLQHSNEEYLKEFLAFLTKQLVGVGGTWVELELKQKTIDKLSKSVDQFNSLQRETNLKKGGEDETI